MTTAAEHPLAPVAEALHYFGAHNPDSPRHVAWVALDRIMDDAEMADSLVGTVNMPSIKGLLAYLRKAHRKTPKGYSPEGWYRAALAQAIVGLEEIVAALAEHADV